MAAALASGRLQLGGQLVVRACRRGHPVPQRLVPVHQARGPLVQPAPPGRVQVAVDGSLHQQVAEPDPVRLLGQDPRRYRFPQGRQRISEVRQRGRRGQVAAAAQHRRRRGQPPGRRAQRAQPRQHHPGQRPRHRHCPVFRAEAPGPGLLQHRPAVQRVTAGLLQQTADSPARQLPGPQRPGQRRHLLRPQAAQPDPPGPVVPGQEPQPALTQPGQLPGAGRHHHQHPVSLQPAHREQQRPRRRAVRPVQVIDQDQRHLLTAAALAQPYQQIGAHRQRVHPVAQLRGQQPRPAARAPRAGHQLTHHAIGQQQFRLITAGPQHHRRAGQPRREPRQQARLAGAGLPLDQHHLRLAAAGRRRGRLQHRQLTLPADKHPPAGSRHRRRQPALRNDQRPPPHRQGTQARQVARIGRSALLSSYGGPPRRA